MSRIITDIEQILADARQAREKTAAQELVPQDAPTNIPVSSSTAEKLLKMAAELKDSSSPVTLADMNSFLDHLR